MPYSDPAKKKAYMAQYNRKYYAENATAIKPRSKRIGRRSQESRTHLSKSVCRGRLFAMGSF